MSYKYLVPMNDLTIRDPNTMAIIPKEGMMLPVIGKEGRYWMRRINDGTMKEVPQPKKEGNK